MIAALFFVTAVVAYMLDPITIAAYAAASYFTRTWLGVLLGGVIAGVAAACVSVALASANYNTVPPMHLFAQATACVLGALALRGIGKVIKARRQATR